MALAMLSQDEKRELLHIARGAIACELQRRVYQPPTTGTSGLHEVRGVFVTLRVDRELRGCIGYIESKKPLFHVVAEVAVKAAFDDPRFPPMTTEEFENATIEISILSPLERISSSNEIEIGTHGLVVACGPRRGLLLPQVAIEHELDRQEFLDATFQKAGLAISRQYSSDVEIYSFQAEVVHENDFVVGKA
ncbi:MAG: AmmeMemoRadiSam system protein A [Ignavibacteriae bacterium]|nr:AmmeMemoRadiSam system protein A [Ignavibacteriota bacterium]